MNNILNNLLINLIPNYKNNNALNSVSSNDTQNKNSINETNFNAYPYFNENTTKQNSSVLQENQNSNILNNLIPLLLSGQKLDSILPMMGNKNPLISSILSSSKDNKKEKIESDKIDVSNYTKVK